MAQITFLHPTFGLDSILAFAVAHRLNRIEAHLSVSTATPQTAENLLGCVLVNSPTIEGLK